MFLNFSHYYFQRIDYQTPIFDKNLRIKTSSLSFCKASTGFTCKKGLRLMEALVC